MPVACLLSESKQDLVPAEGRQAVATHAALHEAGAALELVETLLFEVVWDGQVVVGAEQVMACHSAVKGQGFGLAQRRWHAVALLFKLVIFLLSALAFRIEQNLREKGSLDIV